MFNYIVLTVSLTIDKQGVNSMVSELEKSIIAQKEIHDSKLQPNEMMVDNLPKRTVGVRLDEYEIFTLEEMAKRLSLTKSGMGGVLLSAAIKDASPMMKINHQEMLERFIAKKKKEAGNV